MRIVKSVCEDSNLGATLLGGAFGFVSSPPKSLQCWRFWGRGENRGDADPGRRSRLMPLSLPWATLFCPIRGAIWKKRPPVASLSPLWLVTVPLIIFVSTRSAVAQEPNPRELLAELSRLSARKPFLTDSPDVYLERQSLNQFFTAPIYRKLQGNAYFGYQYDEGFLLQDKAVHIEILKDPTPNASCQAAFSLALQNALKAAGIELNPQARHQLGICIVGMEARETPQTLPGVMAEAYFRNSTLKKSFFIRYGAGHRRGLPTAIRLSAETLVSHLVSKTVKR